MSSHYRLGLAGAFALLTGVGLGRFAYTPIIPLLVESGWFSPAQTAYLGAINLLGYMLGAWGAYRITQRFGERRVLGANLAVITISLFACAFDGGFIWYSAWRLLTGICASTLTVVAAPAVIARVPAARRPGASALVFTGIGAGVVISGTIVPWLANHGVVAAWLGIGAIAAILALWSWFSVWRHLAPMAHTGEVSETPTRLPQAAVLFVIAAYGLDAVGVVPHALFWVDYIARELNRGLQTGGFYWVLFGLGAVTGPMLAGAAASRIGFRPALVASLSVSALTVALPVISAAGWALAVSSVVVGAMLPATVTLTAGSVAELAPTGRHQQFWGWATLGFAVMQAVAGYGFSAAYTVLGSYVPLFAMGAMALVVATVSCVCATVPLRQN